MPRQPGPRPYDGWYIFDNEGVTLSIPYWRANASDPDDAPEVGLGPVDDWAVEVVTDMLDLIIREQLEEKLVKADQERRRG